MRKVLGFGFIRQIRLLEPYRPAREPMGCGITNTEKNSKFVFLFFGFFLVYILLCLFHCLLKPLFWYSIPILLQLKMFP